MCRNDNRLLVVLFFFRLHLCEVDVLTSSACGGWLNQGSNGIFIKVPWSYEVWLDHAQRYMTWTPVQAVRITPKWPTWNPENRKLIELSLLTLEKLCGGIVSSSTLLYTHCCHGRVWTITCQLLPAEWHLLSRQRLLTYIHSWGAVCDVTQTERNIRLSLHTHTGLG